MYYSVNYLIGCDHQNTIRYIFSPGFENNHDAFIFRASSLEDNITNNVPENYHILGDGAYPRMDKLVTPNRNPVDRADIRANTIISKQRLKIKRTFGALKGRFKILNYPIKNKESNFFFVVYIFLKNILFFPRNSCTKFFPGKIP